MHLDASHSMFCSDLDDLFRVKVYGFLIYMIEWQLTRYLKFLLFMKFNVQFLQLIFFSRVPGCPKKVLFTDTVLPSLTNSWDRFVNNLNVKDKKMTINMIPHKCVVSAGIVNTLYVKKTKPLLFISYEGHFLLCIMNTFTRGNTELGL